MDDREAQKRADNGSVILQLILEDVPCDGCGILGYERNMNFVGDKFLCVHCENNLESEGDE